MGRHWTMELVEPEACVAGERPSRAARSSIPFRNTLSLISPRWHLMLAHLQQFFGAGEAPRCPYPRFHGVSHTGMVTGPGRSSLCVAFWSQARTLIYVRFVRHAWRPTIDGMKTSEMTTSGALVLSPVPANPRERSQAWQPRLRSAGRLLTGA
ncbi:hypothetical protein OH76DRAFT_668074 [Lentinus brumalis]|uniref:Uncharacterized protein n=1 Tax=Lentinus brumalis TaxID=2498619 RepID=A0A371D718_9APHY|nr:hypothetical protein OH76DRAFT_668074 [Polyporus brumalis]